MKHALGVCCVLTEACKSNQTVRLRCGTFRSDFTRRRNRVANNEANQPAGEPAGLFIYEDGLDPLLAQEQGNPPSDRQP
jgi:hypothetical protein